MNEGEIRSKQIKPNTLLTVDEVRKTKGFQQLTKKEAKEYIQALVQFCMLAYQMYSKLEKDKRSDHIKTAA